MDENGSRIRVCLESVASERRLRQANADLLRAVTAVKQFQHARFARTYQDLLSGESTSEAARFFLEELYGPQDFTDRDVQFGRVIPALERLLPEDLLGTVRTLAELHALSESLDTRMARCLVQTRVDPVTYADAWRTVGEAALREQQIDWVVAIGHQLKHYTRSAFLMATLRAMRAPARAAGVGALQWFLESGFRAFRRLPDPTTFLETISTRERTLAHILSTGNGNEPAAEPLKK